jgi:hypothetical protein
MGLFITFKINSTKYGVFNFYHGSSVGAGSPKAMAIIHKKMW